jgi:hypothetical protein
VTTYPPNPPITQPAQPASRQPMKKMLRVLIIIVAAIVLLAIGYGVGASASATTQNKLTAARHQLTATRHQLNAARSRLGVTQVKLSTARSDLADARSAAAHAGQIAAKKYAADEAKLAAKEKRLAADEHAVKVLEGQVQSSTISGDGVYVVGKDIKAGTWHTGGGSQCYFATLNSTDTNDISDNNNFDGPETVNVDGAFAFQISGGCSWIRTGA